VPEERGPEAKAPTDGIARPHAALRVLIYVFAVALPVFSLLFEVASGMMANMYMSPVPTVWHFFALLLIPTSIVWTDITLSRGRPSRSSFRNSAGFVLNGFAFGLSALYFLMFLPILPVAAICLLALGLGAMGFSPLFCMLATGYQMRLLYRNRKAFGLGHRQSMWRSAGGFGVAFLLVLGYHGTQYARHTAINLAIAEEPAKRARGVRWLRTLGGEEEVLKACYGRRPMRGMRWSPVAGEEWENRDEYRKLYFRLTGRPFNSVPPPEGSDVFMVEQAGWDEGGREDWEEAAVIDEEVGGTAVAARVKGLSLAGSAMDAKVVGGEDGGLGPGVAYLEWIMDFQNRSSFQREARCQIALPPGAVASRLTLWINGEECEAAFGRRSQVREAYQEVAVVRRRDPALLTTAGPDRVLLQCFPVPANSHLKVKAGFTIPLLVRGGEAYFRLPHFAERNFSITPELSHSVWVESTVPLVPAAPGLTAEPHPNGTAIVHGKISESDVQSPTAGVLTFPDAEVSASVYRARLGDDEATMRVVPAERPAGDSVLCLVIDGSAQMKEAETGWGINWGALMDSIPAGTEFGAIFAGGRDGVEVWREDFGPPSPEVAKWMARRTYIGGRDPVPALEEAWDRCLAKPNAVILWIHAPLPVDISSPEGLAQRFRRRPVDGDGRGLRVLSVQVLPGPNRLIESLGDVGGLESVPVIGSVEETIQYVVRNLRAEDVVREFTLAEAGEEPETSGGVASATTSRHIVRLAVYDAVRRLGRSVRKEDVRRAAEMAIRTRLVTPVSGAVVLENRQQFARHDLDPNANEEAIPAIPEPEEWALIIIALMAMAYLGLRLRRGGGTRIGEAV